MNFISILNEFSQLSNEIHSRNRDRITRRTENQASGSASGSGSGSSSSSSRAPPVTNRSPTRGGQRNGVAVIIGNASRGRTPNNDNIRIRFGLERDARSGFLTFPIDDVMNTLFAAAAVQHPIMTDSQLEEIPKATVTEQDVIDGRSQCAVCFEDYIHEEEVRKLACTHLFHEKCIFPWLKNNATCPVCRARLPNAPDNGDDDNSDIDDVVIGEFEFFLK